ncbi:hypothetical protein DBV05_g10607 [Lasiodiplodia theobromae]|uniref:Apple domain-containing protein n=1 Tax=Lasiodiplodia theobromae TaxID=45133 RepID=A0A5N5CZP5_9PEZI|nr:hypothetical protein DBV05_g10607 [Lasiodiplodia theobromae]
MAPTLSKPTLFLGLLAAQSLATPTPDKRSAAPSCVNNASNGQVYQGTNSQWNIECGTDYAGGDMGMSWVDSFEACIRDCDATTGCLDVAFVQPNACYKKNVLTPAVANAGVWTAKKAGASSSSSSLTCVNNAANGQSYTTSKGIFNIECGVDYAGGDLSSSTVASFEACINDCASTTGCIDVSYVNGACYKKSTLNSAVQVSSVWTAKLSTASTSSGPSCPASNGLSTTVSTGGAYNILCGTDYAGGDMKEVDTASFEACLEACDQNTGCVAVSYVAPSCYLKNVLNTPNAVSYVWGATKAIDVPTACPAAEGKTVTDESGNSYTIKCDYDSPGFDFYVVKADSFDACMDVCAGQQDCVGIAWVPDYNDCWPKYYMPDYAFFSDATLNYDVWLAIRDAEEPELEEPTEQEGWNTPEPEEPVVSWSDDEEE